MKENYLTAYALREKRNELAKMFRKNYEDATQETQDAMEAICAEIDTLMDDDCIEVEFHKFDQDVENPQRIISKGRIIPSANEEYNKFFRFAIGYMNKVSEYTPVIHAHDHYPYRRKVEHSFDFMQGAYKNQFVDDFVYKTAQGEMGIKLGNLKKNCYHTLYNEVLTTLAARPVDFGSTCVALITEGMKDVIRYEGERWYNTNRKIGEI